MLVVIGNDAHHHRHFFPASASMISAICIAAAVSHPIEPPKVRQDSKSRRHLVDNLAHLLRYRGHFFFVIFPAALITNSRFN
jgi:hypothetical protein